MSDIKSIADSIREMKGQSASKIKLTKQEKKFVEIKAETGNGTLAAQKAFKIKNPEYAAVKANRLIRKDNIVNALEEALPEKLLFERHIELLNKREKSIVEYRSKEAGGNNIYEVLDQPETMAVSKGLDMAYKLKGSYAPEKVEADVRVIDVTPLIQKIYGESRGD